ncbi:MAG TPA: PqqD family protein [Tepidisphaeraceae bacterium]|nr:PqqD family protein [Tepidisphaeraceae bacterium]
MFFRRKKPLISIEQAMDARPIKLVDAQLRETEDGGGKITVRLKPPRLAKWLVKYPQGATKTFELDAIGVFVWNLIDGKTPVKQIIQKLSKQYNLNLREAQVPTVTFLQMLIKKGLVGVPLEKNED